MRKFIKIFLCLSFLVVANGCKKLGCSDVNSLTYDADAKKDDGSCVYQGVLTIWFTSAKSNSFVTAGVTELRYYLNNAYIGSSLPTEYSGIVPTCGDPNTFNSNVTLGKIAERDYTLTLRDSAENFISTHGVTLKGNACSVFQLP